SKFRFCQVKVYADKGGNNFVLFLVDERGQDSLYKVKDTYTGKQDDTTQVLGLGGVFAERPGDTLPVTNAPWCMDPDHHVAQDLKNRGKCKAKLVPHGGNLEYISVSDESCKNKPDDATCGKPLMNLIIPPLAGNN